jgi:hypothetical protein
MNSNKLSKEKRNQLVLVLIITLGLVAGLGFGLIKGQYQELAATSARKVANAQKLKRMQDAIKQADRIEDRLANLKEKLSEQEADVASGDLYLWVINTLRQFKLSYKVDMPQFSPISQPAEVNLIPRFPYKQAVLTVGGTARFHDLGRFLADFENQFPHIRVLNLTLDLNSTAAPDDSETLSFKIDVVTLVKPNAS